MNKSKTALLIFSFCVLFQMSSCKNDEIRIGTFKEIPAEAEEFICYFAKDKAEFQQHEYICADDYFKNAYAVINDEKIKFKSLTSSVSANRKDVHWVKKYKSEKYIMIIDMFLIKEIDDIKQQKGTITIKSNDGKKVVTTFYGECDF